MIEIIQIMLCKVVISMIGIIIIISMIEIIIIISMSECEMIKMIMTLILIMNTTK